MHPSVAAGHLEEFEERSADTMKHHVSAAIHWKLLDNLYESGLTLARQTGEAVLVAGALWIRTGSVLVAMWAAAVLLSICGRAYLCGSYRASGDKDSTEAWAWRFIVSAWVEGALWGGLTLLILFAADPVAHVIVAAAIGNKLCEAVVHNAGEPRAALGQVLLMLVPLAVMCFATQQLAYMAFGALALVQTVVAASRITLLHRQTLGLLTATEAVAATKLRLERANRKFATLATTDPLTKLTNRRGFEAALRREWGRAIREHRPITVMLVHLDHMDKLNEIGGPSAGDECLQRVADALQLTLRRATDLAARFGVEEFAIVLPDTDLVAAHYLGDRICAAIEALGIPHPGNPADVATVSIGHSTLIPAEIYIPAHLVAQADTALHRAKASGRRCACAWDSSLDTSPDLTMPQPVGPAEPTSESADPSKRIRRLFATSTGKNRRALPVALTDDEEIDAASSEE